MSMLNWTLRIALFVVLFGLALQNTELATLRFYAGLAWQLPLIVWLLIAFVIGVIMGVLVGLVRISRLRREVLRLRREARQRQRDARHEPSRSGIIDAI
jgi:uncharacterized integral membrane protein